MGKMKLFLVLCLVAFATGLPKFGEKDGSMEEKGKKGPSKGKFMKFILGTDICEDNIPLCPEGSDYFDFISPSDECPTIEEVLAKMEEHKGSMEKDSSEEEYSDEDYSEEDYDDEYDEDYEERKEGEFGEKEGEFGEKEGEFGEKEGEDGKEGKKRR